MAPILDVLGAVVVVAAMVAWGWGLERALGWGGLRDRLGWLGPICLGAAHWVLLLFLLACLGILSLGPLLVAGAASGGGLAWAARRREGTVGAGCRCPAPLPAEWAGGAVLAVVVVPLLLLALYPSVSWDADTYHLGVPRLWLDHGGFREIPFNVYSNWPLATELLFSMALMVRGFVSAKLLHFFFGVAVVYGIWIGVGGRSHRRPWTVALLAAGLFLSNDVVLDELPIAYVELAQSFFLLVCVLAVSHARAHPDRPEGLLLAGVSGGLVASVKVTGIIGPALAFLWLVPLVRKNPVRVLSCIGIPVCLLWFPWLVKSEVHAGNPVYPLLYSTFGGAWWSGELSSQLGTWMSSMGMGREALDYVLLPVRVILDGGPGYERFDGSISPSWLGLVPLAAWRSRGDSLSRLCLGVAAGFFVFWSLSSQQMRLLVPVLPLLGVAAGRAVLGLEGETGIRRFVGVAVTALLLASTGWTARDRIQLAPQVAQRLVSPGEAEARIPPVYRFIQSELPADARLLLLNTNHCFFCERDYVADSFFHASQVADWAGRFSGVEEAAEGLHGLGITHVLVARKDWGISYPAPLLQLLEDPERVRLLLDTRGHRVLEIR